MELAIHRASVCQRRASIDNEFVITIDPANRDGTCEPLLVRPGRVVAKSSAVIIPRSRRLFATTATPAAPSWNASPQKSWNGARGKNLDVRLRKDIGAARHPSLLQSVAQVDNNTSTARAMHG